MRTRGCFGGLLEELSDKPPRGYSVCAALEENVEDEAMLIDSAPEPMFPAADRDHNLVQVLFVATRRSQTANAVGLFPTEFLRPAANRSWLTSISRDASISSTIRSSAETGNRARRRIQSPRRENGGDDKADHEAGHDRLSDGNSSKIS
jgi:hypothetical protein